MYKNIVFLVFVLFCFSSFSVAYAKKKDVEKEAYERAQRESERSFQELEKENMDIFKEPINDVNGTNKAHDSLKNDGNPVKDNESAIKGSENTVQGGKNTINGDRNTINSGENAVQEKPNPRNVEKKKLPVFCDVDYEMIDGLPSWIINPTINGYPISAIGLGIYGAGGFAGQKRAARIQAQGEIAKILNVQVDNELNIEKSSRQNASEDKATTEMKSSSRQRAASVLEDIEELKCWVDPSNNDYYILLGISSDKL